MITKEGEFEKRIEFQGAYDKRSEDPRKNYGVHGVTMRFILRGPKGATQFVLYTNWQLKHVQNECDSCPVDPEFPHLTCHPMPADLGYHAYEQQYEGQKKMGKCDILTDAEGGCYYDGSSTNAYPVYWKFVEEGEEAVWSVLRDEYAYRFDTEKANR